MKRIIYLDDKAVYDMDTGASLKQGEKNLVFMPAPGLRSLAVLELENEPPDNIDHLALACETLVLPFPFKFHDRLIPVISFLRSKSMASSIPR